MNKLFTLTLLLFTLGCQKSDIDHSDIDTQLNQVVEDERLLGLSVKLFNENKTVYSYHAGLANVVSQSPIDDATIYRIASISKTLTAIAVMQLVEQGKIDLQTDASTYLGETLRNPNFPEEVITVAMLMNHTSSLRDGEAYFNFSREMVDKKLDIKELYTNNGSYNGTTLYNDQHKPGEYFSYTNWTWGLLATMVENVSGERFDNYCREKIFKPLKMNSSFNPIDLQEDQSDFAALYRMKAGEWVANADDYANKPIKDRAYENYEIGQNGLLMGPQGSLRCSVNDLQKLSALFWGKHPQVLSDTSVSLMTSKVWEYDGNNGDTWDNFFRAYGYGFQVLTNQPKGDVIFENYQMGGHPGIAYGLLSDWYIDLDKKLGVIFVTNGAETDFKYGIETSFYTPEEAVFKVLKSMEVLEN